MKIGVISDTHLDAATPFLKEVVDRYFKDARMILHAGDLTSPEVVEVFRGREVHVVAGNCDRPASKRRFPTKKLIRVKGFRIGLTHGWGPPLWLDRRVASVFDDVDCLVFGHSHWAKNRLKRGILFFNPGAFKGGACSLWRRSIGILTINHNIRGEIIRL